MESQTFSFRFYTLLVGYHLVMMYLQGYLIIVVGKKNSTNDNMWTDSALSLGERKVFYIGF